MVTATPVTITLGGVTDDMGAKNVLTGQQVSATLNTGGFPRVDAQGDPTDKPAWSFASGGDLCFGSFYLQPAATYGSADELPAAFAALGVPTPTAFPATFAANSVGGALDVDFDVASLRFYTKKEGNLKVKATATVKFPDNTTGSVEAESQEVTSIKPTATWPRIQDGEFFLAPTSFRLLPGQLWTANIDIDAPFTVIGGEGAFCQIATPSRRLEPPALEKAFVDPNHRKPGLDGAFPYAFDGAMAVPGDVTGSDGPVQPAPFKYAGLDILVSKAEDSFETWLMFLPKASSTGQVVTWVPLMKHSWSWGLQYSRPNTNEERWNADVLTNPNHTQAVSSSNHPMWRLKHTSGAFVREE